MKKTLSVLLAVIMAFSVFGVMAYADDEVYLVYFEDLTATYDTSSYRTDYVGKYEGYEYGVDYWFTVTNADGTTTDIKGEPAYVEVDAGDSLEFTVSVADYVDETSVRVLAFPRTLEATALYDSGTGIPYSTYYIAESSGGTYGIIPTEDMTVTVSEWHLYNDAFMYTFPTSDYYSVERVLLTEWFDDATSLTTEAACTAIFSEIEWNNTKVVYENETFYFKVTLPLDSSYTYHYEDYEVYYTKGTGTSANRVTTYIDPIAHYESDTEWVDYYAIENIDSTVTIKVTGTVTYTLSMLAEFFSDFEFEDLETLDFDSIDFSPLVEYIVRILILIVRILNGFGLSIDISSLIS